MKTQLTHIWTGLDKKGYDEAQLKITVEYDTVERTWTSLISVLAIDCKTKSAINLTNIFFECFHDQAEAIIDSIDWAEKVSERPKINWNNVHPLFEGILKPLAK